MTTPVEIERKYLVAAGVLPHLEVKPGTKDIVQGYLATGETEVRVRQMQPVGATVTPWYKLTIKRGAGLVRDEFEFDINADLGKRMLTAADRRIEKRRYDAGNGWTVDVFRNRWEGLILAEVEFESLEQGPAAAPEWLQPHLLREVTGAREYSNQNLAL